MPNRKASPEHYQVILLTLNSGSLASLLLSGSVIFEKWENAKNTANIDHPHGIVPYLWKAVGDHSIRTNGFANQARVSLVDGPRAATITSRRGGGIYQMSLEPVVSCSCGRLKASGVPCYHLVAYCYAASRELRSLVLPIDSVSTLLMERVK